KVRSGEVVLREDEEDVHMAVEAWLGTVVPDVAAKLHTGRSRNDQVATDLKLWCRDAVGGIAAGIDAGLEGRAAWGERHGGRGRPAARWRCGATPTARWRSPCWGGCGWRGRCRSGCVAIGRCSGACARSWPARRWARGRSAAPRCPSTPR